ncbi:hypothetical protein DY000_02015333 [Brassica cretica]|uniref:Uncharacterized protein n=1 Tax=Brassica cretica TaxID=69181 RepID=A0ABQ7CUX6_BRACR|nr:hypothetical protein DY000_02015333 [Brassica cretica]
MLFRQNYRSTIANHRPPNIAKTWLVWYPLPIDNYVQAASQKLDKFITGTQGCSFCKEKRGLP